MHPDNGWEISSQLSDAVKHVWELEAVKRPAVVLVVLWTETCRRDANVFYPCPKVEKKQTC